MRIVIALLLAVVSLNVRSDPFNNAIKLGERYLTEKISTNKYSLSCKSNNPKIPCPVDSMGKIISAFYITDMFSVDNSINDGIRKKIIAMLNKEQKGLLWGYSANSPVDLDDTILAIQTLRLLGISHNAHAVAAFYQQDQNAFSTFVNSASSFPAIKPSIKNNFGIHPEVNAGIYYLFFMLDWNDKINEDLLMRFQTKQGYWPGYFYNGKFYSTYLHLKLLCITHPQSKQTQLGLRFIRSSQNLNGSWGNPSNAYDTALALNTLLDCGQSEGVKKGIKYLLSQQNNQGDWSTDHAIWSYLYSETPSTIWFAYDNNHVLTTALSLNALKKYHKKY